MQRSWLAGPWTVLLALGAPSSTAAQEGQPVTLSLTAGPSAYDLSGTGTSFAVATQGAWELLPALVVEPGLTFFGYEAQFADRVSYLFPEVSIQAQLPRGTVRPFLGVGGGGAFVVSGEGETAGTLHAVGGVRVQLDPRWSLRGELRVRSVDPWVGNTADFMFGVGRRLH
ncbi:MAG TPA: hypothetical protein VFJ92_07460 [Gemmatimonadales bacterium]|jgi:hypothetical protein|nr:hypothetical protein [Gemmatimonadales bacterium]